MVWQLIHIIDILLWLLCAGSVAYVMLFALIAAIHRSRPFLSYRKPDRRNRFLVLYPAYREDAVIVDSVRRFLRQCSVSLDYTLAVISDGMRDDTNATLREMPIVLLQPDFEKSSKGKALRYAMEHVPDIESYDYVVILDADNVVRPDFLVQLNEQCALGHRVIQCHRCAKNANNDVAVLDGVSEEINNTIFRKAHNYAGLPSALIGSGMCFEAAWFRLNVSKLKTAGEDRELEEMLLRANIYIYYAEHIPVFDEKTSNSDNFQRQRMRWMTAQVQSLLRMLPELLPSLRRGNIAFADKTVQQMLIPRSMLIVIILFFALLMTVLAPVWSAKWWIMLAALSLSLYVCIPKTLRQRQLLNTFHTLFNLVFRMTANLFRIERKNTDFIHTTHGNG